jgi:hypothetical protein
MGREDGKAGCRRRAQRHRCPDPAGLHALKS